MMGKPTLRRMLRAARRDYCAAMAEADRRRAFSVMPSVMMPLFAARPTVAGYVSVGDECDPAALLGHAHEMGCEIALPWFEGRAAPMQFRRWVPGEPLAPAPFGGGQPSGDAALAKPSLLLLPLIGFDRLGNRLGQGGGHYDRALERHPASVTIGLGWSVQGLERVPAETWDVPLTHILTEREWITPMKAAP
ncbi:5-formyltetrahydrofolate cyclo-ligase [Novosphingopyxis sp.]|uniref:5-formyltetrahydrofolate cyclo-ligase n=1 Tax=Novosphingopyxis sp. TaxID=2709690 RepID=UPI003B58C854